MKIRQVKAIAFIGVFLITVIGAIGWLTYKYVLFPRHLTRFEIWGTRPEGVPIFMFHENEPEELEEIFKHITRNQYYCLNSAELIDILDGRTPFTGKEIALTFDDGKLALWTITSAKLKQFNLKGIAFINPGLVRDDNRNRPQKPTKPLRRQELTDYCSWGELKLIKSVGVDIQSHSWDHSRHLFKDPTKHREQIEEIKISLLKSKLALLERGFDDQLLFSAPFGAVSESLISAAQSAGYKYVVGVTSPEGYNQFYGLENKVPSNKTLLTRMNYRSVLSLPGQGRLNILERVLMRLKRGGDRPYDRLAD